MATHEFVVPKSIPITLLIILFLMLISIWVLFLNLQAYFVSFLSLFPSSLDDFLFDTLTNEGLKSLSASI